MNTTLNKNTYRTVGEYVLQEAFGIARELEHAGIRTNITCSDATYKVVVDAVDYDRAMKRI